MPHAHASGFPSPCHDRGGQAPALRFIPLCRSGSPEVLETDWFPNVLKQVKIRRTPPTEWASRRRGLKPRLPEKSP